jgi:virginiamycin B lyase
MALGFRRLQTFLVAFALAALNAATAQAYIYWSSNGPLGTHSGTTLGRADLDGTGVEDQFVTGASAPIAMAVDSTHIYWANAYTDAIGVANLNGSDANPTLFQASPVALALDQSHIYWVDGNRYVGRAGLDGSDPQPHFIDLGVESNPSAVALSGGTIYVSVATNTTEQIDTIPAGGGTPSTFAVFSSTSVLPTAFAIASGYLYFSAITNVIEQTGEIGRVPLTGGTPDESFVTGLRLPYGVASDGTHVYWTDLAADTIGRALIGSDGATDVQDSFVGDLNGPWGIAVDVGIDPTTTTVSCLHTSVAPGATVPCTATVHDTTSSSPPAGTVSFTAGDTAALIGNPCSLGLIGGLAQCTVSVQPATVAELTIGATYSGDTVHEGSAGSAGLCVGAGTQCGGKPPPACAVPKLKGMTLGNARTALAKAHCTLGKVTKPRHRHGKLVVSSTKPGAGSKLANGAKVAVKLAAAPKGKHAHR